ncbi:hypothetical protein H4Q26_011970 [Puccinia striiformis f. sp. tritici PST-130]|nr:hypothetical protein H4Q26_011970 [Puccinia striiformis f. sp. tritici PST-130]
MESSAHDSNPKSPIKADPIPQSTRLIVICKFIQDNQLTPKKLWGATGLNSTMVVVKEISNLVQKSDEGRQVWATFIQDEASDNPAIKIASAQSPPRGNYPEGSYQSSNQISAQFCTKNAKQRDCERLVASMPFLTDEIHNGVDLKRLGPGALKLPEFHPSQGWTGCLFDKKNRCKGFGKAISPAIALDMTQ